MATVMLRSLRLSLLFLAVFAPGAAAQSSALQTLLQTQLSQTIVASCNANAAAALSVALARMQAAGSTSMTCPQWTNVTNADSSCTSSVQTAMLAAVSNAAVVPVAYQGILTKQMTAMFSPPCPYYNVTIAGVNVSTFSASFLSSNLTNSTGTTVVASTSNYIVAASVTVNITNIFSSLVSGAMNVSTVLTSMTSALAFSLGVSTTQLTVGSFTPAALITVSFNISCLSTNGTYATALVSRASGLGSSATLTYALGQLHLPAATVTTLPTVFAVGTLQLSSLNVTLIAPAVSTATSTVLSLYPGSTMVSLVSPPLDMQALVQSALISTVNTVCASAAALPLLATLLTVQASGLASLTCNQWSAVATVDSSCLPAVRTTILGLISAVVPTTSKAAMTAQATALLTSTCPLYNVTLANVNLATFSVSGLTSTLAGVMPGNTSVAVQVQDFAVSAQVVLLSIPSALTLSALVPAFTAALATSLGVNASSVTIGTVQPGRRLLSQLTVPFTFSSIGPNTTVAAQKVALVSGLSSPTSALSLGLAQVGVPPVTLVAAPWVSITGQMQLLGTTGANLTAAAAMLAAAIPQQFPGSTFVAAIAPPPPPPAIVINNASSDLITVAAAYSAMLAAQCGAISSPGVLDAAAALLGTPRVACAATYPASAPASPVLAPTPTSSPQSNLTNTSTVPVSSVTSGASKPAAVALSSFASVALLVLLL